jgi:hypothetical protein
VSVPDVRYMNVPSALRVLRTAGFRVAVPYFPPFGDQQAAQNRGRLENYLVVRQRAAAGARLQEGATVTLALTLPNFTGPFGSITEPNLHPASVLVPNLVGKSYRAAMDTGAVSWKGYWVRVDWVAPLEPAASEHGLDAFRVVAQTPAAGTAIPFGGLRPGRRGGDSRAEHDHDDARPAPTRPSGGVSSDRPSQRACLVGATRRRN